MKIRIYVMTHKKFEMPQSPLFRPLHVGRTCGEDLGYPGMIPERIFPTKIAITVS